MTERLAAIAAPAIVRAPLECETLSIVARNTDLTVAWEVSCRSKVRKKEDIAFYISQGGDRMLKDEYGSIPDSFMAVESSSAYLWRRRQVSTGNRSFTA
jgi:hypothetical protein